MKRLVFLFALLVFFTGLFCLIGNEAKALTRIYLIEPGDSAKVTTATPTFAWTDTPAVGETPQRFHIKVADNPAFTNPIWEDTTIAGTLDSIVYPDNSALIMWKAYYWTMRAEVNSQWQEEFTLPHTFFYTTATLFHIQADGHGDLPNIQTGIVWTAANDTVLVEEGTYYENLRFYKDSILVTSNYIFDNDTATINHTIIDGSTLTRGKDYGSVVFFSSGVDSNSQLRGFTIRGGTGTKIATGAEDRFSGGGIYCDAGSSPTIAYNVITNNHVEDDGGGIFINSAAPNIFHNFITHNSTNKGSGGGIESAFSIEVKASPSSRKPTEDEIKNSLNPRDATEIAPALALNLVTNAAAGESAVAVVTWEARKDTVIHRDKFFPGDTIIFNGTGSYDPDGDSFVAYRWEYYRDTTCWTTPSTSSDTIPGCGNTRICILPIDNNWTGKIRVRLRVEVTQSPRRDYSDELPISVQYAPHAVGTAINAAPGDTLWLDASASCDINPLDVLLYHWTQDSGVVMPVTLENADSVKAYFVSQDSTWAGRYKFRLVVSDSMDSDFVSVPAVISRPPTAMCKNDPIFGDTLVGFTTSSQLALDGTLSYDPDPGDAVKYYVWEPAARYYVTKNGVGTLPFSINPAPRESLAVQQFTYTQGGLLKFRLRVKDTFGVLSQNYDSVFYSIQDRAFANPGNDSIVATGSRVDLTGTALDINPDQRNSLKYQWRLVKSPGSSIAILPSDTLQSIYFDASFSGDYILELRADDGFGQGEPDEIKIMANRLPDANVTNVPHAFEGDTILLDASASTDPDSNLYPGKLKYSWSVPLDGIPPGAETPVIVDANQSIARFVPYGTGTYKFRVLINDSLSVKQLPDSSGTGNVTFLTVTVDSTYAYPILQGNLIAHNYAGGRGGGLDCNNSSAAVINNIFYKNQSKFSGGAICCRNSSTPDIESNIFFGNISSDSSGGAISDLKGVLAPSATRGFRKKFTIKYNDFWDNRGGILYQATGEISNNIYSFPRLIDPDFGDFRLECTSPCRGAGDPLHPDIGSLVYFQACNNSENLSMLELSLFQNPAATAVAHFLINTNAPLMTAPVAYVTMGNYAPSPVYFTPISSNSFRGSYVFTLSDTAHISIFARSILEKDTTTGRDFSVQLIAAGNGGTLYSADKKVAVNFPEGAVKDILYSTCITVSEDPRYKFEGKPEMEALGQVYQLGPSVSFEKELTVSFPLDQSDIKDKDKTCFSVYRYDEGKWNQVESYLDGNTVCSKVKNLGIYRLIYDPNAKHSASLPKAYELFQNNPNPFNPETQIKYDLPASGQVQLIVYNILGQKVKVVVNEVQEAGHRSATWDGKDDAGKDVASGIYFYKLQTGNFQNTRKMVLLK